MAPTKWVCILVNFFLAGKAHLSVLHLNNLEALMRRGTFRFIRLSLLVALVAVSSVLVHGQFRAGLQGVVSDANGGAVPGATVTLTNKATNQTQSTVTSGEGFYRFSSLAPGAYSISVEKQDFSKAVVDDVKVEAEAVKGQDVVLKAGAISETVTVVADASAVQTEDASIRKTVTTEEIQRLPQVGRDPYELVRLTPGIVGLGARSGDGNSVGLPNTSDKGGSNVGIFQTENMPPISANGQRGSSNNYQIDGVSVNSQNWGGAAIVTPSQEIVKEIQVVTSTYSAEDGRNSGAQIKTITQNGTNDWHGSLFYKLADPSLNSFNKMPSSINGIGVEGPKRVERELKTYGGSIGGPLPFLTFGENADSTFRLYRDKSWFFFAYEGLRENTNVPYFSWIETPEYRNAVLAQRAGTVSAAVIGAPGGEPRTLQILAPRITAQNRKACGPDDSVLLFDFFPSAIVGNGVDFGRLQGSYGTFANDTPLDGIADLQCAQLPLERSNKGHQYFGRLDFQVTEKARLAFTGTFVPFKSGGMDRSAQSRPQADFFSDRLNFATAVIYNQTFNATTLNEARFSYSGWGFDEVESNPQQSFGIPRVQIEGIFGDRLQWGVPQPGTFEDRQYNFRDVLTKVWGNHAFKFGGEYSRDVNAGGRINLARPLFSFVRPWNLANGTPVFEELGANTLGKPTPDDTIFHTTGVAFFIQDDWKFRRNLTLNLGVRWEFLGPITPDRNVISNLILGDTGGLSGARIEAQDTLTDPDYNNFGPQFGFAWSPEHFRDKLVVRGGVGLAYDRLPNALLNNARRNPGAPSQFFGICCGGPTGGDFVKFQQMNFALSADGSILGYPVHPNLPTLGAPEIWGAPRDLPNASVWRYSLDLQYELPWRTVASIGYTGTRGRNFVRIEPIHITRPGEPSGVDQFGSVFFAVPDVRSNYNALISSLRTRFYKGLSLTANYTYGKSLDTASWEAPEFRTNQSFPVDQEEEYGRSDFDTRHNFNFSAVWDLPFFSDQSTWQGKLLGGWQLSSIVTYNSGYPWTPRTGGCLQGASTSSASFCDPRPTAYDGTAPLGNSNEDFLSGGPFPGSFIPGVPCNDLAANPAGCNSVFLTVFNSSQPFANRPGIGRNTLNGPRYFVTDLSIGKRFGLWGETAGIDLRFNFFNVFNQLNFAPFLALSNPTFVDRAQFGIPTNGLAGRVGEFQARFSF